MNERECMSDIHFPELSKDWKDFELELDAMSLDSIMGGDVFEQKPPDELFVLRNAVKEAITKAGTKC